MVREARACEECAWNCDLTHWKKRDLSPSVSRFFKVMFGPDFAKKMLLPPKFAATMTDLIDQEAKLVNTFGQQWMVTLSSSSDGLAFQKGWHTFVSKNNIVMGDFLVFNYIKRSHFIVQIFGRSGCEKTCHKNGSTLKRARSQGIISAQCEPHEQMNTDTMNRLSLSNSVESGSKSQPAAQSSTWSSGAGNVKSPCLDSSFFMMIGRDPEPSSGEDRRCLYDLSGFEMHASKPIDCKNGLDAEEVAFNRAHTSMTSQAEADIVFTGTQDFNSISLTKTDNVMIEDGKSLKFNKTLECEKEPSPNLLSCLPWIPSNGKRGVKGDNRNLEFEDYRTFQWEKGTSDKLSNSLPLGPSHAEPGRKCDNMSNMDILFQTIERSNKIHSYEWGSPRADEGATSMKSLQEFTAGASNKMVKKETENNNFPKKKRGLESDTSSGAPYVIRQVKPEPFDEGITCMASVVCLAVTDGRKCLELPDKLQSVTLKRSGGESRAVVLTDGERRSWPALYQERSGFLTSNWDKINQRNGVQAGDHYVFKLEDASQFIYSIGVRRL